MPKTLCRDHLGNAYPSITVMCKFYGITSAVYRGRKKQGWTLEKILTTPNKGSSKEITDHLGNVFPSISALCRFYDINRNTYDQRIINGYTLKEALTMPINTIQQVTDHLGNIYPSIKEMCEFYNIPHNVFNGRQRLGWSLKESLITPNGSKHNSAKQVIDHLGNVFPSITEMCKFYDIDRNLYFSRVRYGWSLEKILTTPNGAIVHNAKQVTDHLGNVFSSVKEMYEFYGIKKSLYDKRISKGWTLQETLTIPKHLYIGEYRVAECLKRLNVKYYHDCTIKTIFEDLNININWSDFLTVLQKHLETVGYSWSKQKIQRLRPDFVLYTDENNTIKGVIEFDGEQHQNFIEYFFKTIEEFYRRSNADFVKQSLWEYMNIPMLRIRHDQIDLIDDMVTDFIATPTKYITKHNTYLSEEEYWSILTEQKEKLELAFA